MAASLKVGDVLNGRYPILGILGEGGMGAVYKASDMNTTRIWAIKEMTEQFATEEERQEAIAGFGQEARLLSNLEHPNLPRINDFFTDNGHHYLVMDLVQGETWEKKLMRDKQSVADILDIVYQITDVLRYLHTQPQPIIFRDLKPANVMITPEGVAKLIDFGIARVFQAGKANDTRALGTPGYAAPEQYGSGQSDARTDIYALGVMMHQAFSGIDPSVDPFRFEPLTELLPDFPQSIEDIVTRATALKREERFSCVAEMQEALQALHSDPDVYDLLPLRLRTGILPRPEAKGDTSSKFAGSGRISAPLVDAIPDEPVATPRSGTASLHAASALNAPLSTSRSGTASLHKSGAMNAPLSTPRSGTASLAGKSAAGSGQTAAAKRFGQSGALHKSLQKNADILPEAAEGDAQKNGCWPWVAMGVLLCGATVPGLGWFLIFPALAVVYFAKGMRVQMLFCTAAIFIWGLMCTFIFSSMLKLIIK